MCGLAGYLIKTGNLESSKQNICEMLSLQKHRGPDDSGIVAINSSLNKIEIGSLNEDLNFSNPANLILGFNRLSILDLSENGHQPMLSSDKSVVLMLNGEIYNAFDFKDDLLDKGCIFKSNSDTEIVLNLYLIYGLELTLQKLNGMFAICIWDSKIKKLYLIRDRFGIKPLYVFEDETRLAFSSEIKSFKALSNFKFELDHENLDEFLMFRNLINKTLFKNIRNLNQGTYLEISENGNSKEIQYYILNSDGCLEINDSNVETTYSKALERSVQSQMLSDVKLGCQLSGGIDSSLVTYFANTFNKQSNLETISILFDNKNFSEESYIDYIVKFLNIQSHKYSLNSDYYFKVFEKATWHFEQPINHPNTIGLFLLSEKAKSHVTVLLSGEGADETLAGYSRFLDYGRHPFLSKRFLLNLVQNRKYLFNFLRVYLKKENRIIMASSFGNIGLIKETKSDFNFENAIKERKLILSSFTKKSNLYRKYDIATYLPDLLMRQDKMSMAFSIENRVPFLDNYLVNLALSIEDKHLIQRKGSALEGKFILKEICSKIFNSRFSYRKKQGFSIPLREFFGTKEFKLLWDTKIKPGVIKRKIFNIEPVEKWLININKAEISQIDAIWQIFTFEVWAQQYLNNDRNS
jgi:asparagine synthase (glutamine-hydrolysing)